MSVESSEEMLMPLCAAAVCVTLQEAMKDPEIQAILRDPTINKASPQHTRAPSM